MYINLLSHFLVVLNHVWVVSLCIWSHCDGFAFNSFFVSFIHLVICMVTFSLFLLLLKSFFNHHQVKTIEAQSSSSFVSSKFTIVILFLFHFWWWWWPFLWNYPSKYARLKKIKKKLIVIESLDYIKFCNYSFAKSSIKCTIYIKLVKKVVNINFIFIITKKVVAIIYIYYLGFVLLHTTNDDKLQSINE
jgi:hypothetical protein